MIQLYSRNWHRKAIELKLKGISNRQIARELWGVSDGESKLRKFFKRPDVQSIIATVEEVEKEVRREVRVLFWDIETLPHNSYHWDWWGVNIPVLTQNIELGFMLSHAWSWGIDGEIHSSILTPEEIKKRDDTRIVLEMHSLFDNADVIIAHNGKRFDVKKANASFARLGLKPPSPYKVIDTVRIAKKFFSLPSYSLAFLCEFFNLGVQKVENEGFKLWKRCFDGDVEALKLMQEYNEGDIPTLRKLYVHLRAWGNDGVDISPIINSKALTCPTCGGNHVVELNGKTVMSGRKLHKVYTCSQCNAQSKLHDTKTSYYLSKL